MIKKKKKWRGSKENSRKILEYFFLTVFEIQPTYLSDQRTARAKPYGARASHALHVRACHH